MNHIQQMPREQRRAAAKYLAKEAQKYTTWNRLSLVKRQNSLPRFRMQVRCHRRHPFN